MRRYFFKLLARFNKFILPRYYKKDPIKLNNFQKAIIGFRYWVLMNALD